MKKFRRLTTTILIFICFTIEFDNTAGASSNSSLKSIGDITMITMPIAAIGSAVTIGDAAGIAEFTAVLGSGLLTYAILNPLVAEKRPNGVNRQAFPSGHSIAAFSTSFYLWGRYGWKTGVPATVLASFVGYSRIAAKEHYPHDVLAGAAISGLYSYLFVHKYNKFANHLNVSFLNKNNSLNIAYYTNF